ncbi:MAG: hypothetical protein ACJ74H_16330 [Thermoanaerobaculia bacterium]
MSVRRIAVASLLALCFVISAAAQTAYDPATEPRVTHVKGSWHNGSAGLGDRVTVTVRNFPKLLEKVSGNCSAIVLFLDGLPLRKMPPESCSQYDGTVRYTLDRVPDGNDAEWHKLLGSPNGFMRQTRVSVGIDDQFAFPTDVVTFDLKVLPAERFYIFLVVLVLSLLSFIQLCRRSSMIRAPIDPVTGNRPYSLSRFQMAFWFFLVIVGYVFMWLITGELDSITDSILALMGIGAGTALGAALIDSSPSGTATRTTVASTPSTETVTSVSAPMPPARPQPSHGFINDILSDSDGGVSIHRFQMFAWTLILGVIFVGSVYSELAMPEFNATLLGLMGISSGTYLGFKVPEKKQADQNAAAAPQG